MAQLKGQTGNPFGRPKGSPNKTTSQIRRAFSTLVSDNIEQLQQDIDALEPKERINYIIKMAEFIIPKLQSVSIDDLASEGEQTINEITINILHNGKN